jgi:hypothetical protein
MAVTLRIQCAGKRIWMQKRGDMRRFFQCSLTAYYNQCGDTYGRHFDPH